MNSSALGTLALDKHRLLVNLIFILLIISVVGLMVSIALSSIAMGAAIGLALILGVLTRFNAFPRTPLDFVFLAYCAAELLSTAFSVDASNSLINAKRLFLIAVAYLILIGIDSENRLQCTMGILFGATAFLSVLELLMLEGTSWHHDRLSVFQHYMTAGGIKMFILLLMLPFAVESAVPLKWRIPLMVGLLVTLAALIMTQTRSSWLGFIAGAAVVGFFKNRWLLVLLALIVIAFVVFAPPELQQRAASIFDSSLGSNAARIHMLETGWKMILDYPLFGTGDIDLRQLYVTYTQPIDPAEGGHLHNNFMMLLVTLGAIGFVVVAVLFLRILLIEVRAIRDSKTRWLLHAIAVGSLAAYVGFHVNGLFEWNFGDHEIAVLLWFTVGLSLLTRRFAVSTKPIHS
jgi:O-antigen ligase